MDSKLERHINIRITQEQLDWLDEVVDRDSSHETCISTIIRELIEKEMKWENQCEQEAAEDSISRPEYWQMTKDQQIEWDDKGGVPF